MDLAIHTQSQGHTYLWGLAKSINHWVRFSYEESNEWNNLKYGGHSYLNGRYEKWAIRPLPDQLEKYAANDTVYMPHLYAACLEKLKKNPDMMLLVMTETAKRIKESQDPNHIHSRQFAPEAFMALDTWRDPYGSDY